MSNESKFSLLDVVKAGMRMAPHLGGFLANNIALSRASGEQFLSTGRIFEMMADQHPAKPFLLFEDKVWSYGDFNAWVNRLANLFKLQGIESGDCVALMFENRPELLACVLAANKLGAIAGMVNHNQRGDVLTHSLRLMSPKLSVVGEECVEAFDPVRSVLDKDSTLYWCGSGRLPLGYRDLSLECGGQSSKNLSETREVKLKQKCYYIFTSGTTGMPKAAAMTHLRWRKSGIAFGRAAMRLTSSDVLYCPLPLYHNNALTVALSSVISTGAAIAISRKFSASRFWSDVRAFGATSFIYVGELCRYILNAPPSSDDRNNRLRVIVGNGMRPEIWDEFQRRFGIEHICEFYGASESNLAFVNVFNLKRTAGFCPLNYSIVRFDPDAEAPFRGPDGFMQPVRPGEVGLLLSEVSEKSPFDGYTDKKATEAKLYRSALTQGDCWFNTGDLVRSQGFRHIAFVDRVGDTFRWKGENVATTEVEGVVQGLPNAEEAVVYGVQIPHADGRAGMLALTLSPGAAFQPKELYQHMAAKLPSYAIPLFVRLQAEQETTATFKAKKSDLKREAFALGRDAVFVLRNRDHGYEPLTPELLGAIQQGAVRF